MAKEMLAQSDSHDGIRKRVQDALGKAHPGNYPYVRDMFDNSVVYNMQDKTFSRTFKDGAKGITLGDPTEMEVAYKKVGESHRELLMESAEFNEAAKDGYDASSGKLTFTIIKPGFNTSKSRYYPAAMLKRDFKIFESAKMFSDHQTEKEAKERPEGSVRNWVATMTKVWAESDGRVRGQSQVIDPPFKAKCAELAKNNMLKDLGVSIRAAGTGAESMVESSKTLYVESLVRCKSVDFVTFPGAGGQVEAMESEGDAADVDLISETQLRERRPDLVELIESSVTERNTMEKTVTQLQQELETANAAKAAAEVKEAEATKKLRIAESQTTIIKLITESKLPQPAKDRLAKQFKESETADGVADAIKAEEAYLTSVGSTGKPAAAARVTGMGESAAAEEEGGAKKKVDLKESGKALGLSDAEAEIFARGRKK